MTSSPLLICGLPASPYTRKMLGVLRYRRIVYRLVPTGAAGPRSLPAPKPVLLPIFWFHGADGALTPVTDSTPIIRRLEKEYPDRPLLPRDPALAFLDALIEDFADEWLTKAMFHYRWSYQADIAKAGSVLPNWVGGPMDDAALGRMNAAGSAPRQSRACAKRGEGLPGAVSSNQHSMRGTSGSCQSVEPLLMESPAAGGRREGPR